MFKRTHNCGDLRSSEIDNKVILNGWVNITLLSISEDLRSPQLCVRLNIFN